MSKRLSTQGGIMAVIKLSCWVVLLVAGFFGYVTCNPVLQAQNSEDVKVAAMDQLGNSRSTVDAECVLCEYFMEKIDAALAGALSFSKLNATIYPTCMAMLNESSLCDMLVEMAEVALQDIIKALVPHTICLEAGLCKQGNPVLQAQNSEDVKIAVMNQLSNIRSTVHAECVLCEYFMKIIDAALSEALSLSKVNATVYPTCMEMLNESSLCDILVIMVEMALQDVIKALEPHTICLMAGFCKQGNAVLQAQNNEDVKVAVMNQTVDAECVLCEYFMKKIDAALEGALSVSKVNSTIYPVCMAKLNESSQCEELVEMVEVALQDVIKALEPHTACLKAGLCKQGKTNSKGDILGLLSGKYKGLLCDVCKQIAKGIDKIILQEFAKLEGYMDIFCHRLPPPEDQMCLKLVDQIMQAVEAKLTDFIKPEALCAAVHAC